MGLLADQDDGKKPLFRVFCKQQKKLGIPQDEIFDVVETIRLSSSEEWILIEGQRSVAMLNAESKVGKELWDTIAQFTGKLRGLKIIPAKGKLGFDLEPHESLIVDWEWDMDKLSCVNDKSSSSNFAAKLTLESMQVPFSENGKPGNSGLESMKPGNKGRKGQ